MSGLAKLEDLARFLSENANEKAMITFHSIGDMDAISSAFGLTKILKNALIRAPDFITSNAQYALEQAGISIEDLNSGFVKDAKLIVMVDVNNFEDCGSFEKELSSTDAKIVIIDHHSPSDTKGTSVFDNEDYNSTAGIIYALLQNLGIKPDTQTAEILAMGIYADSAEFRNANAKSFIQLGELLSITGLDFQQLLEKLSRIAAVEARERTIDELFSAETRTINGRLFVKGVTSMHAAIAADDAIKIGADVALFISESDKEVSFSARCRPTLDLEMRIHLGKIMKSLAPIINGSGGGHPCAAGAYGPKKEGRDDFIKAFVEKVFGDDE
jgi:nanoRNase/pAp phosphatase (c-di-AMP/oligoRNAs hydrolase)